jgi:hypothetical protein
VFWLLSLTWGAAGERLFFCPGESPTLGILGNSISRISLPIDFKQMQSWAPAANFWLQPGTRQLNQRMPIDFEQRPGNPRRKNNFKIIIILFGVLIYLLYLCFVNH